MRLDILQSIVPDKNCKHCYGRGVEGVDPKTRAPVFCRCIVKKYRAQLEKNGQLVLEGGKLIRK